MPSTCAQAPPRLCALALQPGSATVALSSVPNHVRSIAISFQLVLIHVFGDVPLPPLMGLAVQNLQAQLGPAGESPLCSWGLRQGVICTARQAVL